MTRRRNEGFADCADARIAVSAAIDGEATELEMAEIEHHLATCASCRAFERDARDLAGRGPRAADKGRTSGFTDRVLASLEPDRSTAPESRLLRITLALVGVLVAVQAASELFRPGSGAHAHAMRHLGVFTVALGVGFVYTALRPRRIGGLLPVATVIAAGLAVTGIIDGWSGRTPAAAETTHLLEIVGLATMWMLTRFERPRAGPAKRGGGLRPVRRDDPPVQPD